MAVPNFFVTIFPKKTSINSEWPKLGHSKFIQTFLVQKDWKKFGMAKNDHSEFI